MLMFYSSVIPELIRSGNSVQRVDYSAAANSLSLFYKQNVCNKISAKTNYHQFVFDKSSVYFTRKDYIRLHEMMQCFLRFI